MLEVASRSAMIKKFYPLSLSNSLLAIPWSMNGQDAFASLVSPTDITWGSVIAINPSGFLLMRQWVSDEHLSSLQSCIWQWTIDLVYLVLWPAIGWSLKRSWLAVMLADSVFHMYFSRTYTSCHHKFNTIYLSTFSSSSFSGSSINNGLKPFHSANLLVSTLR